MSLPDAKPLMDGPETGPDPSTHVSLILQLFVELLGQREGVCLLDVGPTLGANIAFFSHRARRLCVCDLFSRLEESLRRNRPPGEAWEALDYPTAYFDGVLLWDFMDHLENTWASKLVGCVGRWIKPKGLAVVLSRDLQRVQGPLSAFAVCEDFRLHPKPIPRMELPDYPRQNREILALMDVFSSVKSLIYRNGVREYLFRYEGAAVQPPQRAGRDRGSDAALKRFKRRG